MPFGIAVVDEGRFRRTFRFDAGNVTIGRAPDSDLVVHDQRASRAHARIRASDEGYVLVDDGSENGTKLNDQVAHGAARLRNGDRIRVGDTLLEFAVYRESWLLARLGRVVRLVIASAGRLSPRQRALLGAGTLIASIAVTAVHRSSASASRPATIPGAGAARLQTPEVRPATEMFPDRTARLRAVRESYERGRRKLEERRIAPRNLYDAWRAFTATASALDAAAAEAADAGVDWKARGDLVHLIRWTEHELETQCRRLLFGAARSERYGQGGQAAATYREVLLHFPGDDPSGCRHKAQEALAAVESAAPASSVFGYPEPR
jgi:FHA domain-containing protein